MVPNVTDNRSLSRSEKLRLSRLRDELLIWYSDNGRHLPWRSPSANVFERVCVEVLLQRTRAETVARVYPVFFTRFTSWNDIASTSIEELEEHFRPIGLWKRRARSMQALARYAVERDGFFPTETTELAKAPGVGQYIQNAILLFQHGEARPLLDVNMARVIERFIRPRRLADIRHDPWLQAAAHWLVRGEHAIKINWAVLDFGSAVCKASGPKCVSCSLFSRCNSKGQL